MHVCSSWHWHDLACIAPLHLQGRGMLAWHHQPSRDALQFKCASMKRCALVMIVPHSYCAAPVAAGWLHVQLCRVFSLGPPRHCYRCPDAGFADSFSFISFVPLGERATQGSKPKQQSGAAAQSVQKNAERCRAVQCSMPWQRATERSSRPEPRRRAEQQCRLKGDGAVKQPNRAAGRCGHIAGPHRRAGKQSSSTAE